jgi:hypothetical protein
MMGNLHTKKKPTNFLYKGSKNCSIQRAVYSIAEKIPWEKIEKYYKIVM